MNSDNDSETLKKFANSILKDIKSLDFNVSQLVDKNFWDLGKLLQHK